MENDADALALWAKCAPGGSEESVDFDRFCAEFERCHTVELKQTLPADFALALRFVMFPESSTFTLGQLKVSRGDFDLFLKRLGPVVSQRQSRPKYGRVAVHPCYHLRQPLLASAVGPVRLTTP